MDRDEPTGEWEERHYVARPGSREVLVDTGRCRVERHPVHGVVIKGGLEGITINDEPFMVPIRDTDSANEDALIAAVTAERD